MTQFKPNVPVTTTKPTVQVDTRGMNAGEYKFQLVVVDSQGEKSQPTTITVRIGQPDRLRPSDVIISRPAVEAADTKPDTKPDKPEKPGRPDKPNKPKAPGRKAKGDT